MLAADSIGWRFLPTQPRKWKKTRRINRSGYGQFATKLLKPYFKVYKISFATPEWHWIRTSTTLLNNLDKWFIEPRYDVIHFNCGLHDLAIEHREGKTRPRVSLEEYKDNLTKIVERLQKGTDSILIWATNTPVVDNPRATITRKSKDVPLYNEVANRVMSKYNVMINDLHGLVMETEIEKCIDNGGVHLTEYACALLGEHVANYILKVTK